MKILLVEDDSHTQEVLQTTLTKQNFLVDGATDGETAWELLGQFTYDLLLLDVMLPKLDGISLCRRLRQAENPILIMLLTTRDSVTDKLLGLESGADDYLTKPIDLQELTARIHTLTRRNPLVPNSILTYDRLCLDPVSRQVTYNGQLLKIGRKEYLILELLLRHPHQVFNRSEIIDRLWSLDQEIPTEATVKSHIRSIRRKLEQVGGEDLIQTLYGQGYRLNPALQKPPALEQINKITANVWERAYSKSLDKIAELEQAIAILQSGNLEETLRQQTVFTAHKLAGTLGVFGFEIAAQLSQQIEDVFRLPLVPPESATQLWQWIQALRRELDGTQRSIAPPNIPLQKRIYKAGRMPTPQELLEMSNTQSSTTSTWKNTRILAIDDDPNLLNQIQSILTVQGMQTHCLTEATELWEVMEQVKPDLLIVDILLPEIDGLALCQQIRNSSRWAWLPILVLSVRSDRQTVNQVFTAGADDYISKPIVPEELITRLTNRLNRHQLIQQLASNSTH
ncbi:response regulator [Floridanema aerugineum]|uniref:Response regulator n=1 Tax=Floridaenema aerugineum BLCC-F46 TaxID=3153654 RepID=A0ABV4XB41_9CYAN